MALSTIDTNQIANGKVANEDMVASTTTNPFRTNATSIDTDLTVSSTENAGCFGPLTVDTGVTITVNTGGTLVIV